MKMQIQRRLIANVIMDLCARREHLIFRDAWCTQDRVIRFTTPFWQKLFPDNQVLYEAENNHDSFVVHCVCNVSRKDPVAAKIFAVCGIKDGTTISSWDISKNDPNDLFSAFEKLVDQTIPAFEKKLDRKLQEDFVEGEQELVTSTKYERNPQARAACLAYHGYTCKICGMNFEETYGPECKNIIEVHHIVPLSKIGENYVVDPIKDLIPVCPNCHTAVHRKPDLLKL